MSQHVSIVLHIHKTAGQTLKRNFRANFQKEEWVSMYAQQAGLDKAVGRVVPGWDRASVDQYLARKATDRTRCLFGHMVYFGAHEQMKGDITPYYITFLRDPVERCISLYYFLKNNSTNRWHEEIVENGWSLEEWFERSEMLGRYDGQLRHILLGSCEEALTEPALTREHLEEGKRRLRQFQFIGLHECFTEDSYYLYGRLGFLKLSPHPVVNATVAKGRASSALRQIIEERNTLDRELYEHAKELRAHFIRENARAFRFNVNKTGVIKRLHDVADAIKGRN